MSAVTEFEFQGVRILVNEVDGGGWFQASDVCKALEITNVTQALARLDEEEQGSAVLPTAGGLQNVRTITESGVFALILTSRTERAKPFRKWVTSVVLPSIRKTGGYDHAEYLKLQSDLKETQELLNATEKINGTTGTAYGKRILAINKACSDQRELERRASLQTRIRTVQARELNAILSKVKLNAWQTNALKELNAWADAACTAAVDPKAFLTADYKVYGTL